MSDEQLKAFLEHVKADAELQAKLNATENQEAVLEIAKNAGFSLEARHLETFYFEISDEELAEATGGGGCSQTRPIVNLFSQTPT
jgi:predicted ribosomally synthesized peptide with nif11-like leader